ncbi:MAG: CopG family transcriptional regulator [Planctomycetota bacterium]
MELYRNLSELIENTEFRSVTEFAVYVLRDVAADGKLQRTASDNGSSPELRAIEERLRALGYID